MKSSKSKGGTTELPVSFADVQRAAETVKGAVINTDFDVSRTLGEMFGAGFLLGGAVGDAGEELGVEEDAGGQLAAVGGVDLVQAGGQDGVGGVDVGVTPVPADQRGLVQRGRAAGIGGSFLEFEHTMEHFRAELFEPALLWRRPRAAWDAAGRPALADAAEDRADALMAQPAGAALPEDRRAALRAVERRLNGAVADT